MYWEALKEDGTWFVEGLMDFKVNIMCASSELLASLFDQIQGAARCHISSGGSTTLWTASTTTAAAPFSEAFHLNPVQSGFK